MSFENTFVSFGCLEKIGKRLPGNTSTKMKTIMWHRILPYYEFQNHLHRLQQKTNLKSSIFSLKVSQEPIRQLTDNKPMVITSALPLLTTSNPLLSSQHYHQNNSFPFVCWEKRVGKRKFLKFKEVGKKKNPRQNFIPAIETHS